jgi:nucleoside-diphosphate-sugar epimerase
VSQVAEQTDRRITVIGGTGNIGTSVIRALAEDPSVGSVVGIARRQPRWTAPKLQWISADITADPLVEAVRGSDAVILLAWLFQPTHDSVTTWRTNVLGSLRVLDAVAEAGVPALIYSSSVGAYSPGPKDTAVDESWPTHGWPTAAYTREKAYLERALDAYEHDHPDMRVVRLRPGFVFKQAAASQQRRLFAGPLLPGRLVRPATVPVVPDLDGLRFQAVHAADLAEAFRLAASGSARGAFNIAADPVVDAHLLAQCLGARVVRMPVSAVRLPLAVLWRLHLVPASPYLFDAVRHLPIMDTAQARAELGWSPRHTSRQAVEDFLTGLRQGAGLATPPLAARVPGGRAGEIATGIGQRP